MDYLFHKSIKAFTVSGTIHDESAIVRLKEEFTRLKKIEMREYGYVERLDIDPNFTILYNSEKEYFEFILTVYGTYVGKSKVKWITGIDGAQVVPTVKSKLKESLQDQM